MSESDSDDVDSAAVAVGLSTFAEVSGAVGGAASLVTALKSLAFRMEQAACGFVCRVSKMFLLHLLF